MAVCNHLQQQAELRGAVRAFDLVERNRAVVVDQRRGRFQPVERGVFSPECLPTFPQKGSRALLETRPCPRSAETRDSAIDLVVTCDLDWMQAEPRKVIGTEVRLVRRWIRKSAGVSGGAFVMQDRVGPREVVAKGR